MNVAPGRETTRYRAIAKLGRGGMARVYLMLAHGPGGAAKKLLVTKELLPELREDAEYVTMFVDEARLALRLNHPNVIHTYEVSGQGKDSIIVMEYLEGQTLSSTLHRVGRSGLPTKLHLHVIAEVLAGLHHAHELCDFDGAPFDVVHRDVNPQNVFLTYDGQVKLVDFGIAKASYTGHTRAGVFKGKANYAAAEQIRGIPLDRRADVFAVGVMMWEALAKQLFTSGLTEVTAMERRLDGKDPPIEQIAPDTPPELVRICNKALARDASDRYATAEDMRAELVACLGDGMTRAGRELKDVMTSIFADERAKIRQLIDTRVKEIGSAPTSAGSVMEASMHAGDNPPSIAPRGEASSGVATRPPLRQSGRRRLWAALGIATVSAIVGVVGYRALVSPTVAIAPAGSPSLRASNAAVAPPPADPATAAALAAPTGATGEQVVNVVQLSISVTPADASIFLDDVMLVANPFEGKVPRGSQSHRLRCVARGYVTDERTIHLDVDQRLEVMLRPLRAVAEAPPPPPPPPPPALRVARPAAAHPAPRDHGGVVAGSAAPIATPTTVNPGDTLTLTPGANANAKKPQRTIDDKF